MFLDHRVSGDQNKSYSLGKTGGLKKYVEWIVTALEIAKEAGQFYVFLTFYQYL